MKVEGDGAYVSLKPIVRSKHHLGEKLFLHIKSERENANYVFYADDGLDD